MIIHEETNFDVPLEIIRASEVEPKEVKWLWYPYIPFGKVTILQGDPGDGKSTLALKVASILTKGDPLPFTDEEPREPVTVIYQTILRVQIDTINILWLSFFNLQNHYKICAFPFFPAHPHGIGYRFLTCNFRLNGRLLSY